MARQIKFKNVELAKLLEERNKLVLQGRKDDQKRQDLEDKLKKAGLELQKIDGKATEILKDMKIDVTVDPENKTFEQIMGASLEKGEIVVEIEDRVEAFVASLAKQLKDLEKEKTKPEEVKEDK